MPLWSDEQERPIQHLRVIDLTVMLPGPYLTRILAQYGADVIKVEALPDGDPVRAMQNTAVPGLLNQGKRSVAINLKTAEGIQIIREMASEADIFIESFREGVMDKLGIGYPELSEVNPDLLYVSLRGLSGERASQPAHDLNFIANSGCAEWYLENQVPNYSLQLGDLVGGMYAPLTKMLMHLANPARQGMHLVNYMDEGFRSLFLPRAFDTVHGETRGPDFGYYKQLNGERPHTRFYKCRDGQWVALQAMQKKHWDSFCEVIDKPQWRDRQEDKNLVADLEKLFAESPATYWEAVGANKAVCLTRVPTWQEYMIASPARSQLTSDPLSWAGFAPNESLSSAPTLGHDTLSVVHGLGHSPKEISEWMARGILLQDAQK